MGQYEQIRPSSPSDEHWTRDDLELQEHGHEKTQLASVVDEQQERLLSEGDGDESCQPGAREDLEARGRRRRWWRLGLFGLAAVAILAAAAALLYQLYLSELKKKESENTFRRQASDYIIDPDWDYNASSTVREYHWVISDTIANPDGVFRPMMVINGQFPGPMIVCNEGDTVVVNVVNQARNATAIHWHGLFQNGTNFMDGTVGATQCPIATGQSFRYEFQVKGQAGSYFYHGHQAAQGLDGLFGPFIILSREEKENQPIHYDTDRVVMVQDWYHDASDGLLRQTLSPGSESSPIPNGALINGQNKVDCSLHPNRRCDSSTALLPTLDVAPGKRHRLRIINVGGFAWFEVSIDKHLDLPVTEVDGVTVEPASDSAVLVGPGQRYSIVLNADRLDTTNHLYWFRARMLSHCFAENVLPDKGVAMATAVLRYNSTGAAAGPAAAQNDLPRTEADSGKFTVVCKDPAPGTYRPLPARRAPEHADHSWYLRVNLEIGDWRLERGFLNRSTLRPQLRSPTLHRVVDGLAAGDASFAVEGVNDVAFDAAHELVVGSRGVEVVDVVLQNFDEGNHPFHLHGMQMFVLAAGHGYFPGYEALGLRPGGRGPLPGAGGGGGGPAVLDNPLRRDVTTVEGFGWTLVRFVADNPGVWLLHCHMIWHAEAGMGMQFVARLDAMRNWTVPEQGARACAAPVEALERGATPKDEIWFGHLASDDG